MAKKGAATPQTSHRPVLTARQAEIFEFLREAIVARGHGPTVREIGQHFGIASPNGVTCHLKALEKKGLIWREANMSHAIHLSGAPEPPGALPLIGQLVTGQPLQLLPDPLPRLEFAGLFASAAHCCLRVIGQGLKDDQIADGDYLVIRRQSNCRDGELVLAILDDKLATVKRLYREGRQFRLESISRAHPPVLSGNATVIGLVVGVIRQF